MATWRIRLLGSVRAESTERVVDHFRTRKTSALLAYLAHHVGAPQRRESLIDLLWPTSRESAGRNCLSRELSDLRRRLEPPRAESGSVLETRGTDFVLLRSAAVATDVQEFEKLATRASQATPSERIPLLTEAVGLVRGPFVALDIDSTRFEQWRAQEGFYIHQRYLAAMVELVDSLEAQGETRTALHYAEDAVAADELRQDLHRRVMRLQVALGRKAAALRQYERLEAVLRERTGQEPDRASQELFEQLRSQPLSSPPVGAVESERPVAVPAMPTGTVTLLQVEFADSAPKYGPASGDPGDSQPGPQGWNEDESTAASDVPKGSTTMSVVDAVVDTAKAALVSGGEAARCVAFDSAPAALDAVVRIRSRLSELGGATREPPVAIALHTVDTGLGPPDSASGFPGRFVDEASRIAGAAHPGQVLCTEATAALLRSGLDPQMSLSAPESWRLERDGPIYRVYHIRHAEWPKIEFPPLRALPIRSGLLPVQHTRFFGRERELEQIELHLRSPGNRLLTLTGPPGVGKSRLAVESAYRVQDAFEGSVWFVPLAGVEGPSDVPGWILKAMKVPLAHSASAISALQEQVGESRTLVVLDNYEQLLGDEDAPGNAVIQALLAQIANLCLLVTSRRSLKLAQESLLEVEPLAAPTGRGSPQLLAQSPSVQLFVDRAKLADPAFRIGSHGWGQIADVCGRLAGLPLAIELLAAWSHVLSPATMLSQLPDRLAQGGGHRADGLSRHASLAGALDWSLELLPTPVRGLFADLSVFRGGWSVAAAEAVTGDALARDHLAQLADASLIREVDFGDDVRYEMLEPIRQFSHHQLDPDQRNQTMARHLRYFRSLAESAEPELSGPDQKTWLERLEAERLNLTEALRWAVQTQSAEEGLRLCGGLWRFWWMRGSRIDDDAGLKALLETPGTSIEARLAAHRSLGVLQVMNGDLELARKSFEAALHLAREVDDVAATGSALSNLGWVAATQRRPDEAMRWYQASLEVRESLGEPAAIATLLFNLASLAHNANDLDAAWDYSRRAREQYALVGDWSNEADALVHQGQIAMHRGDYVAASELLKEAIPVLREQGDLQNLALALEYSGQLALDVDVTLAADLFAESMEVARRGGFQSQVLSAQCRLAEAAALQGALDDAERLLIAVLDEVPEERDATLRAECLSQLGLLRLGQGRLEEALRHAQTSVTLFREAHWPADAAAAAYRLGAIKAAANDPTADETRRDALAVLTEAGRPVLRHEEKRLSPYYAQVET